MREPPRLAVFVKGWPRLSETFIAQELFALQESGVPFMIVSLRRPLEAKRHPLHDKITATVLYLPEYLHQEPLRLLRALKFWRGQCPLSREKLRRLGQALIAARELPESIKGIYAHFLHSPSRVAGMVAAIRGLPFAASAHAKDIYTTAPEALRPVLEQACWVTTCTAANRDTLRQFVSPPEKIMLHYHGLDSERFPVPPQLNPGASLRLLCVARLVEKKGIDDLLEALALLPPALDWRLEHIGGGDAAPYKAQAERLGLSLRIAWRGAQAADEVLEAYRRADVVVLPAKIAADGDRDGLPNVLLEAGSQGCAVIATPVSAIPELIEDGLHGRLVPACSPAALAAVISELAANPALRRRLGAALQQRVSSAFSAAVALPPLLTKLRALSNGDIQ